MRLPRRVPWSSLAELEQLCSWIYTDEDAMDSIVLAINRLSAWRAITYLPHALESTLSLLVVILQDKSSQTQSSHLTLRQSYSAAIIRLVNGFVDPLQLGAFARSIASIASQLNLPPWLVELRHAATHEDLPSIDLLREAARESMAWLLHNYFLPTMNPSSVPASQPLLRPIAPTLKQYKRLLKITTRDTSLMSQYKPAVLSVMRDTERWIAEAKVAANVAAGEIGWEASASDYPPNSDVKERWALERLCDALLEKGALVPLSNKKRIFPTDPFHPPNFSVLLWTPLLQHLQSLHPDFLVILAGRIVSSLLMDNEPIQAQVAPQVDPSYDMCLARWVLWSIETWEAGDREIGFDLRQETITNLMQSLGHSNKNRQQDRKAVVALLESLCRGTLQLEAMLLTLEKLSDNNIASDWNPDDISVMDQRLSTLLTSDLVRENPMTEPYLTAKAETIKNISFSGWRLLHEDSGWKPCAIGVHCTTT